MMMSMNVMLHPGCVLPDYTTPITYISGLDIHIVTIKEEDYDRIKTDPAVRLVEYNHQVEVT